LFKAIKARLAHINQSTAREQVIFKAIKTRLAHIIQTQAREEIII